MLQYSIRTFREVLFESNGAILLSSSPHQEIKGSIKKRKSLTSNM